MQPQTIKGRNGDIQKREFVIEVEGKFPRKVCISSWGDKIDPSMLVVGKAITVSFELESREYNGRWYTDVKAWKASADGGSSAPVPDIPEPGMMISQDEGDLPF
jgi:hypothetical protein